MIRTSVPSSGVILPLHSTHKSLLKGNRGKTITSRAAVAALNPGSHCGGGDPHCCSPPAWGAAASAQSRKERRAVNRERCPSSSRVSSLGSKKRRRKGRGFHRPSPAPRPERRDVALSHSRTSDPSPLHQRPTERKALAALRRRSAQRGKRRCCTAGTQRSTPSPSSSSTAPRLEPGGVPR